MGQTQHAPGTFCWAELATTDAAGAKARELGGAVLKDAFDVFDIGSMAVLKDPTGRKRPYRLRPDHVIAELAELPGVVDQYS